MISATTTIHHLNFTLFPPQTDNEFIWYYHFLITIDIISGDNTMCEELKGIFKVLANHSDPD